jgi:hypothetical protein
LALQLDMGHVLHFLDMLRPGGRHTIASEAPFGSKDGGPLWERGTTHEVDEREALKKDIRQRQARGSNVYYSVNEPCSNDVRIGQNGKNTTDDIISINALAFDIDIIKRPFDDALLVDFIDKELTGALRPSLLISTGGGYHLIYLLENKLDVALFRPAANDEQKAHNTHCGEIRQAITQLAHDFEFNLRGMIPAALNDYIKIDNMSNIDRVMRLPGTVNYPKLEKKEKGQVEALAHIFKDYQCRVDLNALRDVIPGLANVPVRNNQTYVQYPKNPNWPPFKQAMYLCEQIRDHGLADANSVFVIDVMLPLIGMIHDDNKLTIDEALECFLEAVCGGARYGTPGRGHAHFMRSWRSHRPEIQRHGKTKSIGSLIHFCKENGIDIPWIPKKELYDPIKHDPNYAKKGSVRLATIEDMYPGKVIGLAK